MTENQTKIIQNYKKISKFFFNYLVFLIAIIAGILVFQNLLLQSKNITIFEWNNNFFMQKTKLIGEFNKFMKQNIEDNDMNIHILQGDLEVENWFIKSVNNLISYKWFVLPKYFYVYGTIPIKQLSYFSWGDYAIDELENIINTFVFTKRFTISKPFTRVLLPLNTSLQEDFNLACLFENKLSSRTCNVYLYDFLDSFFVYTLSKDYQWLQDIFSTISQNTTEKEMFCQWLWKYLLYANDYSETIEELFGNCGQEYADLFKRTTLFMEIQSNLKTKHLIR